MLSRNYLRHATVFSVVALLFVASACRRHKYENPIAKDTQQPDKVLFDTSIDDIEKGRFERARLTLQTLMNTYDTSEYLAKAKLAVADSWLREGGAHGFAQAEAEYKDFILFYPNMEEAAEAQFKICDMQYKQMDKADRDPVHARTAEFECKDVLLKFPNSKFAPQAQQRLLEVQEVIAGGEDRVGQYYFKKGGRSFNSAANRLQALADQYPLYSHADDALWMLADAYLQLGDKYESRQADAYTRIVRDYPLSSHVQDAKAQLQAMGRPIPEADSVAYARMKYEQDNRTRRSLLSKITGPISSRPDTSMAAKSGSPQMENYHPTVPLDVPATAAGALTTQEVGISVVGSSDAIDKNPDARQAAAAAASTPPGSDAPSSAAAAAPGAQDQPAAATSSTAAGKKGTAAPKKLKQVAAKPAKVPKVPRPASKKGTAAQKGTADSAPTPDKKQ
ncbi:MAG TPA: outer membrane protein assembly factor BamD [Bryobacteraceae bacterium]|nr:outer membrane protein assembly factor BamD [Bryobacteraceae bacterium]